MKQPAFHLCQVNIARAVETMDHPVMEGFVSQLDAINRLADSSEGFIWRLQSESGNATDIQVYDDPLVFNNMSVWRDLDSLFEYTYKTKHAGVMADRKQWFEPYGKPFMALWWMENDRLPDMNEAKRRLEHLEKHGPTPYAFTFKHHFPMPEHSAPQPVGV